MPTRSWAKALAAKFSLLNISGSFVIEWFMVGTSFFQSNSSAEKARPHRNTLSIKDVNLFRSQYFLLVLLVKLNAYTESTTKMSNAITQGSTPPPAIFHLQKRFLMLTLCFQSVPLVQPDEGRIEEAGHELPFHINCICLV